jgi:hypothetical protein
VTPLKGLGRGFQMRHFSDQGHSARARSVSLAVPSLSQNFHELIYNTNGIIDITVPYGSKPVTPSGYVYSYFIVAPTTIKIKAAVFNSRLNQYIYSNEISLKYSFSWYNLHNNETSP